MISVFSIETLDLEDIFISIFLLSSYHNERSCVELES